MMIPTHRGTLSLEIDASISPPTTQLTTDHPITPMIDANATSLTNHHPNRNLAVTICLQPDWGPIIEQYAAIRHPISIDTRPETKHCLKFNSNSNGPRKYDDIDDKPPVALSHNPATCKNCLFDVPRSNGEIRSIPWDSTPRESSFLDAVTSHLKYLFPENSCDFFEVLPIDLIRRLIVA